MLCSPEETWSSPPEARQRVVDAAFGYRCIARGGPTVTSSLDPADEGGVGPVSRSRTVSSWSDLIVQLNRGRRCPIVLMADVEPAVRPWGAAPALLQEDLTLLSNWLCSEIPYLSTVAWVSNAPLRSLDWKIGKTSCHVIGRARKPLRRSVESLVRDIDPCDLVVIGDQWWTDGLLAVRLRCGFALWTTLPPDIPPWPALQYRMAIRPVRTFILHHTQPI